MLIENINNMVADAYAKGFAEGFTEGYTEGYAEGMRMAINQFATVQWGTLPHELIAKLDDISEVAQFETMNPLLFHAKSLQEFENIIDDALKHSMQ